LSQQDGKRNSDSIASKLIQGGAPVDLDGLRFSTALNVWEFAPFGGGGATVTQQRDQLAADETTSSTTFVNTSLGITLANRAGGFFIASAACICLHNTANAWAAFRWNKGGTAVSGFGQQFAGSPFRVSFPGFDTDVLDGDALDLQFLTPGGVLTFLGNIPVGNVELFSHIEVFEVS